MKHDCDSTLHSILEKIRTRRLETSFFALKAFPSLSPNESLLPFQLHQAHNLSSRIYCHPRFGSRFKAQQEDRILVDTDSHPDLCFFAVFDGHGGSGTADFLKENLVPFILEQLPSKFLLSDSAPAIATGFKSLQQKILITHLFSAHGYQESGSTACVAIYQKSTQMLFLCNVGDSRAVFISENLIRCSTKDHKPSEASENTRILGIKGGFVIRNRVQGVLSTSRAFGDSQCQPWAEPVPEFTFIQHVSPGDRLILGSDGLFEKIENKECITNSKVVCLIPCAIARESHDNVSMMAVVFEKNEEKAQETRKFVFALDLKLKHGKPVAVSNSSQHCMLYMKRLCEEAGISSEEAYAAYVKENCEDPFIKALLGAAPLVDAMVDSIDSQAQTQPQI